MEEDASMFDEFLKDNDRNAVEAIKVLVVDTKLYVDEYLANVLNDSRRTVLSLVFSNVFAAVVIFLDGLHSVPNITIASSYSGRCQTSMMEVFATITSKSCELFF